MSRLVRNFFSGQVSRTTLLTGLLMGFTSYIGTVAIGISMFPGTFDWRRRVMSRTLSPDYNPDAYWIPALGIAASALLILPFAGYVQRRVHAITPRGSRLTGVSFAIGILLFLGVALPLPVHLPAGLSRLHEVFARTSTAALIFGAFCCSAFAFKDRQRSLGSRRVLSKRLAFCWMSLPPLLLVFGLICGIMLLGRMAQMEWALYAGRVLRPTMFWQLAFWEWVGLVALFGFLFVSALWLPEEVKSSVPNFTPMDRFPAVDSHPEGLRAAHPVGVVNGSARMDSVGVDHNKLIAPQS